MRRRLVLLALLLIMLLGRVAAAEAPPAKAYRVGVLCPVTCATSDVRTFRAALAERGYRDGANTTFE